MKLVKPLKSAVELSYSEAANVVGVGERTFRRHVTKNPLIIQPIRYGHRTVTFELNQVISLKKHIRQQAIKGARR